MKTRVLLPLVLFVVGLSVEGSAQVPQVLQLPTFRSFSVSTTVSVPDRGHALLGGVDRARYASRWRGIPLVSQVPGAGRLASNRASAASRSASRASVSVTIIDHAEHDRRLLAEAAASRTASRAPSEIERKAAFLSKHVARRGNDQQKQAARTRLAALAARGKAAKAAGSEK